MIWQAPWVWAGIAMVLLPVLIHLLGQGKAKRLPFPTLQFFGAARPLPTRRTRLHDLLLLAVRMAILAAAVAALAQPLLLTAARHAAFNESLARAVVVDTSASMQRALETTRAIDVAQQNAQRLADSAGTGVVLRTSEPRGMIAGAVAWLRRQPGRGELVILSDFQPNVLDSFDVAAIPADIGVRLVRVLVDAAAAPTERRLAYDRREVTAQAVRTEGRVDVNWVDALASDAVDISILAGATDASAVEAAQRAAATIGVALPVDTARHIAIVFPGYPDRTVLLKRATTLHAAWMVDAVARLRRDPAVAAAAATGTPVVARDTTTAPVAVRDDRSGNLVYAAADTSNGRSRLLLFPLTEPSSLLSASVIASARQALSGTVPVEELDPSVIPDAALASWQRPASARTGPAPDSDLSDGRWFWVIALVLLGVEALVRRAGPTRAAEMAHDNG